MFSKTFILTQILLLHLIIDAINSEFLLKNPHPSSLWENLSGKVYNSGDGRESIGVDRVESYLFHTKRSLLKFSGVQEQEQRIFENQSSIKNNYLSSQPFVPFKKYGINSGNAPAPTPPPTTAQLSYAQAAAYLGFQQFYSSSSCNSSSINYVKDAVGLGVCYLYSKDTKTSASVVYNEVPSSSSSYLNITQMLYSNSIDCTGSYKVAFKTLPSTCYMSASSSVSSEIAYIADAPKTTDPIFLMSVTLYFNYSG